MLGGCLSFVLSNVFELGHTTMVRLMYTPIRSTDIN